MFLPETELVKMVKGIASTADHAQPMRNVGDEQQVSIVKERDGKKTDTSQNQT